MVEEGIAVRRVRGTKICRDSVVREWTRPDNGKKRAWNRRRRIDFQSAGGPRERPRGSVRRSPWEELCWTYHWDVTVEYQGVQLGPKEWDRKFRWVLGPTDG